MCRGIQPQTVGLTTLGCPKARVSTQGRICAHLIILQTGGDESVLGGHVLVAELPLPQHLAVVVGEQRHEVLRHLPSELIRQHGTCDRQRQRQAPAGLCGGEHLRRIRRLRVGRVAHVEHQPRRLLDRQHRERDLDRGRHEAKDARRYDAS